MMVSIKVFAFYFHISMWLPCPPMRAQPLGFAPPQHSRIYPWQAYVPHDAGPWPTPEVHQETAPSIALCRAEYHATHPTVLQSFHQYVGAYSFVGLAELPYPSAIPA